MAKITEIDTPNHDRGGCIVFGIIVTAVVLHRGLVLICWICLPAHSGFQLLAQRRAGGLLRQAWVLGYMSLFDAHVSAQSTIVDLEGKLADHDSGTNGEAQGQDASKVEHGTAAVQQASDSSLYGGRRFYVRRLARNCVQPGSSLTLELHIKWNGSCRITYMPGYIIAVPRYLPSSPLLTSPVPTRRPRVPSTGVLARRVSIRPMPKAVVNHSNPSTYLHTAPVGSQVATCLTTRCTSTFEY